MQGDTSQRHESLVPVLDRARYLAGFRTLATFVLVVHAFTEWSTWQVDPLQVVGIAAAYAALTWLLAWRMREEPNHRGLTVLNATLLLDGIAIGLLAYWTGWMASPLRYLFVVHALAVTLGASFRSGIKLCVWHVLVVLSLAEADAVGVLVRPAGQASGDEPWWFLGLTAAAVLVAASGAWVNERDLRRNRFDLDALATMGSRFEQLDSPADTARVAVEAISSTFETERVVLFEAAGGSLQPLASVGSVGPVAGLSSDIGSGVLHRVVTSREIVLAASLSPQDDVWLASLLPAATNLVIIPLVADDAVSAVLVVEHGPKFGSRLERRSHDMILRFAAHVGLAWSNAMMAERIREIARRDGLTGLFNRRAFDESLAMELDRASRTGTAVGLAMIDIDHFKRLNDGHGHQVGDEVLRVVGEVLREESRRMDVAARYGGEEFAVIFPGADTADCTLAGERMRSALADAAGPVPITVSVGVASVRASASSPDVLIRRADDALYRAKAQGRNRVCTARPASPVRSIA